MAGTDRGQYGLVFPGQQFGGGQFGGGGASGFQSGNESQMYGSIQKLVSVCVYLFAIA